MCAGLEIGVVRTFVLIGTTSMLVNVFKGIKQNTLECLDFTRLIFCIVSLKAYEFVKKNHNIFDFASENIA